MKLFYCLITSKIFCVLSLGWHVEVAKGSPAQNYKYCTKEETRMPQADYIKYCQDNDIEPKVMPFVFFPDGVPGPQGRRTDIDNFVDCLKCSDFATVALDNPTVYVKYSTGLAKLDFMMRQKKAQQWRTVTVHVIYGSTGVGKTRSALQQGQELGTTFLMRKDAGKTMWWDGYTGQKVLVLDEYHGNWMPYKSILGVLDGHPYRCPVKGSHVWGEWETVLITSCREPHGWYERTEYTELDRRITSVTHMDPLRAAMPVSEREEWTGWAPPSGSGGNTAPSAFPTSGVTSTSSTIFADLDLDFTPQEYDDYAIDAAESLVCMETL